MYRIKAVILLSSSVVCSICVCVHSVHCLNNGGRRLTGLLDVEQRMFVFKTALPFLGERCRRFRMLSAALVKNQRLVVPGAMKVGWGHSFQLASDLKSLWVNLFPVLSNTFLYQGAFFFCLNGNYPAVLQRLCELH